MLPAAYQPGPGHTDNPHSFHLILYKTLRRSSTRYPLWPEELISPDSNKVPPRVPAENE